MKKNESAAIPAGKNSRRSFIFQMSQAAVNLAIANTAVYAIGCATKELDGSIVAGAKNPWFNDHGFGTTACDNYINGPFATLIECETDYNDWISGGGPENYCRVNYSNPCQ